MVTVLHKLPVPSSSGLEPEVEIRTGPTAVLTCSDGGGGVVTYAFAQVLAYKVTYHTACTSFMINNAYDRLVGIGQSNWLAEIQKNLDAQKESSENLRHFMIYFDDGPCFEFIGRWFSVESNFPATIPPEPWLKQPRQDKT